MWHIRRACNVSRAAMCAKTNKYHLGKAINIKLPNITSGKVRNFLNPYIEDDFDKLLHRIKSRKYNTVVFWHEGKIRDDHYQRINGLNQADVIGYYDNAILVRDLMDDLIAYIYDTTGDSMI